MPRARVSPEKRKRTARACDSCKRSKLKCNGLHPCSTCSKEDRNCTFGGSQSRADERTPPFKRQLLDDTSNPFQSSNRVLAVQVSTVSPDLVSCSPAVNPLPTTLQLSAAHHTTQLPAQFNSFPINVESVPNDYKPNSVVACSPLDTSSQVTGNGSGPEEEAVVYNFPRLLEDPTGRLQYVGDSATLSYLQIIRKDVESIAGPSPFTTDPHQHQIVENTACLPYNVRNTRLIPERNTAIVLVDAFVTNICGLFQVFNNVAFMKNFNDYYSDPLHADPNWLCLFQLTLAIGLVLVTPSPGTQEDAIIQKLRADPIDQAEVFYCNARHLGDPTTGFENADFWSIQALLLMAIYNLAISKRNAAFAYCGMASRSGFALGLHREETLAIFNNEDQALRRNLWRSVFVLDCFLAASMGRPTAISEEDCSEQTLRMKAGNISFSCTASTPTDSRGNSSSLGLEASIRSCRVICTILKRVYSKRNISTKLAQEIANECALWPEALDPSLHWRQMTTASMVNPSQGIAILHVNLLYCHAIILLTRPFFLFLLNKVQKERMSGVQRSRRIGSRMEKFSEGCVSASCHTIFLVQIAMDGKFPSSRNPFVTYFVFAAALIILSNEFFKLYAIPMAKKWIQNSISVMSYCATRDPVAERLHFILSSFRDVVDRQKGYVAKRQIINASEDPIFSFLSIGTDELSSDYTRRSSNASIRTESTGTLKRETTDAASYVFLSQVPNATSAPERPPKHGSLDGNDSIGDGENDFEAFWKPGMQSTPVSVGAQKWAPE